MTPKKDERKVVAYSGSSLNVTENVINLAGLILKELFGDITEGVAQELMRWNDQTFSSLIKRSSSLSSYKGKVLQQKLSQAMIILIKHNLVTFSRSSDDRLVRYTFHAEQALNLIRYPRFIILAKTLFGDEGEVLVEELLFHGQERASNVIYRAGKRLGLSRISGDCNKAELLSITIRKLHSTFIEMMKCHFIGRTESLNLSEPDNEDDNDQRIFNETSDNVINEAMKYSMPPIDLKPILERVNKELDSNECDIQEEKQFLESLSDNKVLCKANISRFHREFRDLLIVQAVQRRIDVSAGNLMRVMLTLMNETSPWLDVSTYIHGADIISRIQSAPGTSAAGADSRLQKYHDEYLKVLAEDRTRFCDKVGDAGGGQFMINSKHIFTELASATAENIVLEKFGSKALRIFRVIREKLHVEESQLPIYVMIPAKEIKLLTYQLLENNFIQLQELRKNMSNNAPTKSFYLFYVDLNQVARTVAEMCRKALANSFTRKNYEAMQNKRLLDKQVRVMLQVVFLIISCNKKYFMPNMIFELIFTGKD